MTRTVTADEARMWRDENFDHDTIEWDLARTVVELSEQRDAALVKLEAVAWAVRDHESCSRQPCQVCAALGAS